MDTIIEYLQNPMKIGVHTHKLTVDFSGLSDFLKELIEKYKESWEKSEGRRRIPKRIFGDRLSSLTEALEQLDKGSHGDDDFFKSMLGTLREFSVLDDFPRDLADLFLREVKLHVGGDRTVKRKIRKLGVPIIFKSHVIPEAKDVLSIEKKPINGYKWFFDIITIKKGSFSAFMKCLQCIPPVKEQMKVLKERKQFSTRYTFRPYPLATQLWLRDNASIAVPPDLKSFLQGAIRYIFSNEWRTSIVLSAISVESMLADLYEEEFKEPAPDTPLGTLFQQVKEKIVFPPEIINAINITNESRIAAVHRSRFPVSDKEAINALFGATNFTLWYCSQF